MSTKPDGKPRVSIAGSVPALLRTIGLVVGVALTLAALVLAALQGLPLIDTLFSDVSMPRIALLGAVAAYAVAFSIVRHLMIAGPKRAAIDTEREILRSELQISDLDEGKRGALLHLLDNPESAESNGDRWLWNGQTELNVAMRLAAVRQLLPEAYSEDDVHARLHAVLVAGRIKPTSEQKKEIKDILGHGANPVGRRRGTPPSDRRHSARSIDRRGRALLRELQYSDAAGPLEEYRSMLTLYRKSWWLAVVALGAVTLLGLLVERSLMPLLAGAIGGFLATVFRFTRPARAPTDYKTTWALITLAVPVGALGGAVAVALLAAVDELGPTPFKLGAFSDWLANDDVSGWPLVIAAGFLGGFSARFIDRIAERLDSVDTPPPEGRATSPQGT